MALNLPATHTAGDTLNFTDSLSDYDPATWAITYTLVNSSGKVSFTSTDNGDGTHLIDVAATITANWPAGEYTYQATVSDGTDRHTVGTGQIELKSDFASQSTFDGRSNAQQWLDALEDARLNMQGGVATVAYGDESISYSMGDLIKALALARREVAAEQRSSQLGYKVLVRF